MAALDCQGIWLTVTFLLFAATYAVVMASEDTVTYTEAGVLVERRTTQGEHHRVKREIARDMTGFNDEEKMAMLRRHNDLRSSRSASDMIYMEWNAELAESAQSWAEKCIFEHSPGRGGIAGFRHVGENLYAGTHEFDPANVVQLWYNEVKFYTYKTKACTDVCGHYTQVVWSSSGSVGCGVKYCPKLKSASFGRGYHVVCHYGPGGNYVGERPYGLGEVCSKCPKETHFCVMGLCSKRPKIGGSKAAASARSNLQTITASLVSVLFISRIFR